MVSKKAVPAKPGLGTLQDFGHLEIPLGVERDGRGSFRGPSEEPESRRRRFIEQLRQELEPLLELTQSLDNKREEFYKEFYKDLLSTQEKIQGDIGEIYKTGTKDRDTLLRILTAMRQEQFELTKLQATVEDLRKWAQVVDVSGFAADQGLIDAVASMKDTDLGLHQYFEVNLPLIPGILNYKIKSDLVKTGQYFNYMSKKFGLGGIWCKILSWINCTLDIAASSAVCLSKG